MHAVVNHLHFNKPVEEFQAAVTQEGLPLLAQSPGFRDAMFVKEGPDRGVIILLWDTADDAMNGAKTFGPTWFAQNIAPHLASEQQRTAGEVLAKYRE